jgi:hypothetical protein
LYVIRFAVGPKREEVTGSWRKLNNEELHNLCFTPLIIRVINSREGEVAGHVARMVFEKCIQDFSRKLKRREGEVAWRGM